MDVWGKASFRAENPVKDFFLKLQLQQLLTRIKYVFADVMMQHVNDGRAFVVRNVVKNFIYFLWIANRDNGSDGNFSDFPDP